MIVYIVYAKIFENKYYESVDILENMEEKNSFIIGQRKKIKKVNIGKINSGNFIGAFHIILTDKEKVQEARETLKEHLYLYQLNELRKTQEAIDVIEKHNLDKQIKFKL